MEMEFLEIGFPFNVCFLWKKVKKSKAPRRDPKYARKTGDGSFNIGKGFAKSVASARSKPASKSKPRGRK
jgi:hypothetical protein